MQCPPISSRDSVEKPTHVPRPSQPAAAYKGQSQSPQAADGLEKSTAQGRMPVRFGIEIEMTHLSLARMHAQTCAALNVAPMATRHGYGWDYDVRDAQARVWEVKVDGGAVNEISTPIFLTSEDLQTLGRVAVSLASAGACTLGACGLHIHVDAASFFPRDMVNIMALVALYQQPLEQALQVRGERQVYCKRTDPDAVRALYAMRDLPRDEFCMRSISYVGGRDRNINMTNLIARDKHTIEFRLFNATLDPTLIGHYTAVVMGMVQAAKGQVDFYQEIQRAPKPTLAQFCASVGLNPAHGVGAFLLAQPQAAPDAPRPMPARLHRRPSTTGLDRLQAR